MALYTAWDSIFNAFTAGVMALFGVWVLTLRPRSRTSIFLGVFAVVHGVTFVVGNLWDFSDLLQYYADRGIRSPLQVNAPDLVLNLASAGALFGLAHAILSPEGRPGRFAWRLILWAVPASAIGTSYLYVGPEWIIAGLLDVRAWVRLTSLVAEFAFYYAFAAMPLVFAWLYRRAVRAGGPLARNAITLSGAFVIWPALFGGFGLRSILLGTSVAWVNLGVVVIGLATGVLWLANIHLDKQLGGLARNAALLVFALLLFGVIDALILWEALGYSGSRGPFYGLARVATVVVLAYAILHRQVFGLDVKFRFAISKGTVAAVILAVIFIASEGAQALFGDDKQWLGLVAGGIVVLAISPLQQAADRLAEKALPTHAPSVMIQGAEQHERYRVLLRRYLGDGRLTRDEELALAHAAAGLGIPGHEALRLRHEVEDEGGRA